MGIQKLCGIGRDTHARGVVFAHSKEVIHETLFNHRGAFSIGYLCVSSAAPGFSSADSYRRF
jgi:hypothetical protein